MEVTVMDVVMEDMDVDMDGDMDAAHVMDMVIPDIGNVILNIININI